MPVMLTSPRRAGDHQFDIARHVDVQVGDYALVRRALGIGVERDDLVVDGDLGLGLAVVAVGIFLLVGANLLADRNLQRFAVVANIDVDRAALVVDAQRSAGRELLAEFVAVVVRGSAEQVFQVAVVAELDVVPDVRPHADKLGRDNP